MSEIPFNGKNIAVLVKCWLDIQRIDISFAFSSKENFELGEQLFAKLISTVMFKSDDGLVYQAISCTLINKSMNMSSIVVLGRYESLLLGKVIPKKGQVQMHFEGIENCFSKNAVLNTKTDDALFSIEERNDEIDVIIPYVEICDYVSLREYIVKVRQYFEFLLTKEIRIDSLVFSNETDSINVMNDMYFMSKNDCVTQLSCNEKPDAILHGLKLWLGKYDEYSEPIHLWTTKTIYNRHVSDEDIFIWTCQAFELICTLKSDIMQGAKKIVGGKKDPNVEVFLNVFNDARHFAKNAEVLFSEVKNARNIYTHYNPQKHITEREWNNAKHMIDIAMRVAFIYALDLGFENIGFAFFADTWANDKRHR